MNIRVRQSAPVLASICVLLLNARRAHAILGRASPCWREQLSQARVRVPMSRADLLLLRNRPSSDDHSHWAARPPKRTGLRGFFTECQMVRRSFVFALGTDVAGCEPAL
jgi:hypothetical protein